MNETDRNPPFLTDQDWHISGSYDLEKIEEIKLRQQAEVDAIARSDLEERCASPPAECHASTVLRSHASTCAL